MLLLYVYVVDGGIQSGLLLAGILFLLCSAKVAHVQLMLGRTFYKIWSFIHN